MKEFKSSLQLSFLNFCLNFDNQYRVFHLFWLFLFNKGEEKGGSNIIFDEIEICFYFIFHIFIDPVVSSFVSWLIGKYCDDKRHKPLNIIIAGLIINVVGSLLIIISGLIALWKVFPGIISKSTSTNCIILDNNDSSSEDVCLLDTNVLMIICLVIYGIGFVIWSAGHNIVEVVYKYCILDKFHSDQQNRINLMRTTQSGLAHLIPNFICAVITMFITGLSFYQQDLFGSSDDAVKQGTNKTLQIAFSISMIVLKLLSTVSLFFGCSMFNKWMKGSYLEWKRGLLDEDDVRCEEIIFSCSKCKPYCKKKCHGISDISSKVYNIFMIVFFGSIVWTTFTNRIHEMTMDYYGDTKNGFHSFQFLSFFTNYSLVGCIVVITSMILYIRNCRLDILLSLSFIISAICSIFYYFITPIENGSSFLNNYLLTIFPLLIGSIVYCLVESFAYKYLRQIVSEENRGFIIGLMNIFSNVGSLVTYWVLIVYKHPILNATDETQEEIDNSLRNLYIFLTPFSFIAFIVSLVLFTFNRKSDLHESRDEDLHQPFNLNESITLPSSKDE